MSTDRMTAAAYNALVSGDPAPSTLTRASLFLPFPVPLYACFVKSKGGSGIPSKRYQAYGVEAANTIRAQGSPRVSGPVSVRIFFCAPNKAKRDGDNLLKCLFDTLKANGVIEDDNNQIVRRFGVEWVEASSPCRVEIIAENAMKIRGEA